MLFRVTVVRCGSALASLNSREGIRNATIESLSLESLRIPWFTMYMLLQIVSSLALAGHPCRPLPREQIGSTVMLTLCPWLVLKS